MKNSKNIYFGKIGSNFGIDQIFVNLKNKRIFKILQFGKPIFYNFQNYQIFWVVKWFRKDEKKNRIENIELIFCYFDICNFGFRNISHSKSCRSKFWLPPDKIWISFFFKFSGNQIKALNFIRFPIPCKIDVNVLTSRDVLPVATILYIEKVF